ncbi:MAG: peptide deformylase [Chloroflexi bacterium]|nr:MAG: peptide deformylase [Chloroflexota bacterium]
MILDIVTLPNQVLRHKTLPVTKFDDDLQKLIDDMIETMREANGVGLAAPQVDYSYRFAIIETLPEVDEDGNEVEGSRELFVVVNPEIIWKSRDMVDGIEGCLSIPGYVGEVTRHESIRVRAQDRYGKKMRHRLHGWTARIFQHEIDHLDGVLFIDKLTAPENFWTDEEFQAMQEDDEDIEQDVPVGD